MPSCILVIHILLERIVYGIMVVHSIVKAETPASIGFPNERIDIRIPFTREPVMSMQKKDSTLLSVLKYLPISIAELTAKYYAVDRAFLSTLFAPQQSERIMWLILR